MLSFNTKLFTFWNLHDLKPLHHGLFCLLTLISPWSITILEDLFHLLPIRSSVGLFHYRKWHSSSRSCLPCTMIIFTLRICLLFCLISFSPLPPQMGLKEIRQNKRHILISISRDIHTSSLWISLEIEINHNGNPLLLPLSLTLY